MSLERSNPLRMGVFWIDLWSPPLGQAPTQQNNTYPAFVEWLNGNADRVRVLKHEGLHSALNGMNDPWAQGRVDQPQRDWVLFQTLSADTSPFPAGKVGFPTIQKIGAPEVITPADGQVTSGDTVQRPPPDDLIGDFLDGLKTFGGVAIALALGFLILKATKE